LPGTAQHERVHYQRLLLSLLQRRPIQDPRNLEHPSPGDAGARPCTAAQPIGTCTLADGLAWQSPGNRAACPPSRIRRADLLRSVRALRRAVHEMKHEPLAKPEQIVNVVAAVNLIVALIGRLVRIPGTPFLEQLRPFIGYWFVGYRMYGRSRQEILARDAAQARRASVVARCGRNTQADGP
jgi:hypothetical protein